MKEKAISYVRVSTKEQEEKFSLDVQRKENEEYAKANNLQIAKFFKESESGFKLRARIEFYKMLEYLEAEKKIRHLICYFRDRLSRNLSDLLELRNSRPDLIFHSVGNKPVDFSNPDEFEEWYRLQVDIADAERASARQRARVLKSNIRKREKGEYTSRAPLGYWHNPYTKKIELDHRKNRANLVKQAFEFYSTGDHSLKSLTDKMRNLGLITRAGNYVSRATMGLILRNPFYYGEFFTKSAGYPEGKLYPNKGTYPPLISKALWLKVQDALNKKKTTVKNKKDFTYRGILECAHCGCMITAEIKKGIRYYHCTSGRNTSYYQEKFKSDNCPKKGINWREDEIEYAFTHAIGELHFDKGILSWLREKLYEDDDNRKAVIDAELNGLNAELEMIDKDIEKVFDYAVKNDSLGDLVNKKIDRLKLRKKEIIAEIAELEEEKEDYIADALQTLELMKDFKNQYFAAESQKRKQMHKLMFRTVLAGEIFSIKDDMGILVTRKTWKGKLDNNNNLGFIWNEPFKTLFDIKLIQEISEYEANKGKNDIAWAVLDSNQ
jgi:site-specific DNA recombinase